MARETSLGNLKSGSACLRSRCATCSRWADCCGSLDVLWNIGGGRASPDNHFCGSDTWSAVDKIRGDPPMVYWSYWARGGELPVHL